MSGVSAATDAGENWLAPLAERNAAAVVFLTSIPLPSLHETTRIISKAKSRKQLPSASEPSAPSGPSGPGQHSAQDLDPLRGSASADEDAKIRYAQQFLLSIELGYGPASETATRTAHTTAVFRPARHSVDQHALARKVSYISSINKTQEAPLLQQGLLGARMVLSDRRSDALVSSYVRHRDGHREGHPERRDYYFDTDSKYNGLLLPWLSQWLLNTQFANFNLAPVLLARHALLRDPQRSKKKPGVSYASLLKPMAKDTYDPFHLDDPRLKQGKHHCVLRLESYQMSVVPFLRPQKLKIELNEQFRLLHPWAQAKRLTLSKLRNLRKDLLAMSDHIDALDISTVAMAWVHFEKLVLSRHVDKSNRKLMAGVCLVLAFKFNHEAKNILKELKKIYTGIRQMDKKDRLNFGDIRKNEWPVFRLLEFSLHIPPESVHSHLNRLLEMKELDYQEYYGAE